MVRPVVPYAASLRWYKEWFHCREEGMTDPMAISEANRVCGIRGKDFTRTSIGPSDAPLQLSMAVEGGSSRLKRPGAEHHAAISLHGNWPHVHIGALEARYGRMPYYQHIIPSLKFLLQNMPATLMELNQNIHELFCGYLQPRIGKGEEWGVRIEAVRERGCEIARYVDENLSVIDALMRFGPEINLMLSVKEMR